MEDCLFCKIVADEIPSNRIYESDDVVGFQDVNPQAPHHVLFIPRSHIQSAQDLTAPDAAMLAEIFGAMATYASTMDLDASGYRVVTNVGAEAGQSVPHLHFHLLGGRRMKWPPG